MLHAKPNFFCCPIGTTSALAPVMHEAGLEGQPIRFYTGRFFLSLAVHMSWGLSDTRGTEGI